MPKKKSYYMMGTHLKFLKYLAMLIFILMPFVGFYLGILYENNIYIYPNPLILSRQSIQPTPTPHNTEIPDELRVNRSISSLATSTVSPMSPFKTITDPELVRSLYVTIIALPQFPTPPFYPAVSHCTINAQRVLYELNFYKKGELIHHGILSLITCGGGWSVTLDGIKHEFTDQDLFASFHALLEETFGVTRNQLYGR